MLAGPKKGISNRGSLSQATLKKLNQNDDDSKSYKIYGNPRQNHTPNQYANDYGLDTIKASNSRSTKALSNSGVRRSMDTIIQRNVLPAIVSNEYSSLSVKNAATIANRGIPGGRDLGDKNFEYKFKSIRGHQPL